MSTKRVRCLRFGLWKRLYYCIIGLGEGWAAARGLHFVGLGCGLG